MGNYPSANKNYNNYIQKLDRVKLKQLHDYFHSISDNLDKIPYNFYHHSFLSNFIPKKLSYDIFMKFVSKDQLWDINSFTNFYAFLMVSTREEKIEFIQNIFFSSKEVILPADLIKLALQYEEPSFRTIKPLGSFQPQDLKSIIERDVDSMNISKLLFHWDEIFSRDYTPIDDSVYLIISGAIHVDAKTFKLIDKSFKNKFRDSTDLTEAYFVRLFSLKFPEYLLKNLFNLWDINGDGKLDSIEFISGISDSIYAPIGEKYKFLFHLFNYPSTNDGYMSQDHVCRMVNFIKFFSSYTSQIKRFRPKRKAKEMTFQEIVNDEGSIHYSDFIIRVHEKEQINTFLEYFSLVMSVIFELPGYQHFTDVLETWSEIERVFGRPKVQVELVYLISEEWWTFYRKTNLANVPSEIQISPNHYKDVLINLDEIRPVSLTDERYLFNDKLERVPIDGFQIISSQAYDYALKMLPPLKSFVALPRFYLCNSSQQSFYPFLLFDPTVGEVRSDLQFDSSNEIKNDWIDFYPIVITFYCNQKNLTENAKINISPKMEKMVRPKALLNDLIDSGGPVYPLKKRSSSHSPLKNSQNKLSMKKAYTLSSIDKRPSITRTRPMVVASTNPEARQTNLVNEPKQIESLVSFATRTLSYLTTETTDPDLIKSPKMPVFRAAFSRLTTLDQLYKFLSSIFEKRFKSKVKFRLWIFTFDQMSANCSNVPLHVQAPRQFSPFILDASEEPIGVIFLKEPANLSKVHYDHSPHIFIEFQNDNQSWPEDEISQRTLPLTRFRTIEGLCGLVNLGNSCYMNATLQALSQIKEFREALSRRTLVKQNPLTCEMNSLFERLWDGNNSIVRPSGLKTLMGKRHKIFNSWDQNDAIEFLMHLLDMIGEENLEKKTKVINLNEDQKASVKEAEQYWNGFSANNHNIVTELFYGLLGSRLTCQMCEHSSLSFEPCNILSLEVKANKYFLIDVDLFNLSDQVPERRTYLLQSSDTFEYLVELIRNDHSGGISDYLITTMKKDVIDVIHSLTDSVMGKAYSVFDLRLPKTIDDEFREELNGYKGAYKMALLNNRYKVFNDSSILKKIKHKLVIFNRPIILRLPYLDFDLSCRLIRSAVSHCFQRFLNLENHAKWKNHIKVFNEKGTKRLFKVYMTNRNGSACAICEWSKFCQGCPMKKETFLKYKEGCLAFSIEWDPAVIHLCYKMDEENKIRTNRSHTDDLRKKVLESKSLERLLDSFTMNEEISASQKFICSECKTVRPMYKKLEIWKLPKYLIIHLKRFSMSRHQMLNKTYDPINYPINGLSMEPFLAKDEKNNTITFSQSQDDSDSYEYDLIASVCHYGKIDQGHYVTFAFHSPTDSWYCFNDTSIKKVDKEDAISDEAYFLIYKRRV